MDLRSKHVLALALLMSAVIGSPAQVRFKVEPNTPVKELLPARPKVADKLAAVIDDDFT